MSDQTTDLDAAVTRLKRELTAARMECDILKRAVAYFAKAKLPGGRSQ
jgi:transposase-like protein